MNFTYLLLLLTFTGTQCFVEAQTEQNSNLLHDHSDSVPKADIVEFKKLAPNATPAEPLVINKENSFDGCLAYSFDVLATGFEQNGTLTYLALEAIHLQNSAPIREQFYTVEKSANQRQDVKFGVVFDPQFSPDGKYILFKFGDTGTYGAYNLYVLDIKSNVVKMISKRKLSYRRTLWSPDSKYVAYVAGSDAQGLVTQGEFSLGALRLYACQWEVAEERLVVENDTIRGSFAWATPHTLLYGVLPDETPDSNRAENKQGESQKGIAPRPNIYEYSVEQGKSRLLIKDGYRPLASADGQWIAFFGSEHPKAPYPLSSFWMEKPGDAVLTVARNEGGERKSLNLESGLCPYVIWEPDNRHLLTIQDVENGVVNGRAKVTEWDIQTGKFRVIAILEEEKFGRAISDFKPLSFSPDGSTLFFSAFELMGRRVKGTRGVFMAERNSLHALNLATGEVTPVAQFKSNWGVDWLPTMTHKEQ